jgi:hypothetical protein
MKFVREQSYLKYLETVVLFRKLQLDTVTKSTRYLGIQWKFPETEGLLKQAIEQYETEKQRIADGGIPKDVYSTKND